MGETEQLVAITVVSAGDGLMRPGTVFPASAEIADELIDAGGARRAAPAEIPPEALAPLSEPRVRAIQTAVVTLGESDFTQAGTPKVASLQPIVGFVPTAEETALFKRPA